MEVDAVLEVEAGDPQIAIEFLQANVNLSKSRLKDLMSKGGVWRVTKTGERERIRRAMTDILVGEQIEIFYNDHLLAVKPMKAELLHDAGQYSVWRKPSGMPWQGSDFSDHTSFERAVHLAFQQNRDVFWLPALDYDASGIVVMAHSRKAAAQLNEAFEPGALAATLIYKADVYGDLNPEDASDVELNNEEVAKQKVQKEKYEAHVDRSQIRVTLQTAYPRQIRESLAAIGHPVVGDTEFYNDEAAPDLRLKLVTCQFECPLTHDTLIFE